MIRNPSPSQARGDQAKKRKNGQSEGKDRALSRRAIGPDFSALPGHQLLADVQSQAKSFATWQRRICCLKESFENPLRHVLGNSTSRIRDLQNQKFRIFLERTSLNFHHTVCWSELDGVFDQDDQNLSKACGVST